MSVPGVRTTVSISGFTEDQAVPGIACILEELGARPWLRDVVVEWAAGRQRLVVTVASDGDNPAVQGGQGGANYDEISDCIWACYHFPEAGIELHVDASSLIGAA